MMLTSKISHDISLAINKNMVAYKNKASKSPKIETISSHSIDGVHETKFTFNAHTGTHVDFPLHFIENGKTSNDYSIDSFMGKCQVLDLTNCKESIKETDLINFHIKENEIILLKTHNNPLDKFDFDFVYLSESGANYLKSKNIKAVGIDQLGIERSQPGHPTHKTLLSNDILIYEGLNLCNIDPDYYEFIGLPLAIDNVEASLVRASLIQLKKVINPHFE